MPLHPDFPEATTSEHRWDQPTPLDDIASAFEVAGVEGVTFEDIASVTHYSIDYHGVKWEPAPGDSGGGTELGMVLLGTLNDGRWFGLEAWNDYTGWGCQDNADLYVGPTREDVIANGITADGRAALGVSL